MRLIDADALIKVIQQNDYMLTAKHNSMAPGMFTSGIRQAVDEAPTIDPVKWIPVTEMLPEKPYGCLVIVEQDDYWGEPREVMYPHFVGYDGEQWNDSDGEKIPLEATHWMPLPDPPRKDDEA